MRLRKEYLASVIGLAAVLTIYFFIINSAIPEQTFLSPTEMEIYIPKNCSQSEIQATWDSIFQESSEGIEFVYNTSSTSGCENIIAMKNTSDEMNILLKLKEADVSNLIGGVKIKSNPDYISEMKENMINIHNSYKYLLILSLTLPSKNITDREIEITSENMAESNINNTFKINSSIIDNANWVTNSTYGLEKNYTAYIFTKYQNNNKEAYTGLVYTNISFSSFFYTEEISTPNCTPNWTASTTDCSSDENQIQYYTDSNNCQNNPDKPSNQTINCDYDNNGIIGRENSTLTENINLKIKINNSNLNLSESYSGTQKIKIYDNSKELIEFDWNFETALDLKSIEIKQQPSLFPYGYLIINGINTSKKIYLNKINPATSKICVKKTHLTNITSISTNCNSTNEYLISCPGIKSGITCNITNQTFTISGLTNSAVKEFGVLGGSSCTVNWTCDEWSSCINGKQTRNCIDQENCGVPLGRPPETQDCGPSCSENWNCTDWKPEKCPKDEIQTKICTDLNNCGTTFSKPNEERNCEYKSNTILYITLILITLFILLVTGAIFYLVKTRNNKQDILQNTNSNTLSPIPLQKIPRIPRLPPRNFPPNNENKFRQ
jgi:hypothetical protein